MTLRICGCLMVLWASAAAGQTAARSSCPADSLPPAVQAARAALDRDPALLEPRLKLADRLVDQGCYNDAVTVLAAGQAMHPRSGELTGKLRDVRSMLTEQTYIQGLTQAEDAAREQRNQLRCTKLVDLESCNEALKITPNDAVLVAARADALSQAGRMDEAVAGYQRALQLNPSDETLKPKLATAMSRQSPAPVLTESKAVPAISASSRSSPHKSAVSKTKAPQSTVTVSNTAAPVVRSAITAYSNDAPEGRSN